MPIPLLSVCMGVTLLCSGIAHAEEVVVAKQSITSVTNEKVIIEQDAFLKDLSSLSVMPELEVELEKMGDSALVKANSQLENVTPQEEIANKPLKIGKHVSQEIDLLSMIISLSVVLLIILASAFLLKRIQGGKTSLNGLKLISSLHLGTKEKVVVVQAGKQQWILGVTPQQINVLSELAEPLNDALNTVADEPAEVNNVPVFIANLFKKPK